MWRITLKGVAAHKLRYALTGLAVILGVAFMAGTLVLTDTINSTFDNLYTQIYQSTGAVVRAKQAFNPANSFSNQRQEIPASLANTVRAVPGVRAVSVGIEGYAQLVGRNGKPIGHPANGPPTLGEAWSNVAALNPLQLEPGGRPPTTSHQVVIDKHSADVGHFKVGDRVVVLTQLPPALYTITGIATWAGADSPLGASITTFDPATAARVLGQPGKVDQIDVQAAPGVTQAQLVQRIGGAVHDPRIEVVTGHAVTQENQTSVHQALSVFGNFLMVFALIALFVGSFLIFNTFSIVIAQRTRELALLRAVGASRTQVLGSVLGESAVVGLVASAIGLAAGLALAAGLKAALAVIGMSIPATGLVLNPRTAVVALCVGTAVTMVSAVLPARRAARVAPVAALQDVAVETPPQSVSRVTSGAFVTAAGALALGLGLFTHAGNRVALVGGGAAVLFVGIAILGPLVARPMARHSIGGELARQNAMRNPARTTATAAAHMVGVALVSLMTIIASSEKASINSIVDSAMRADFVISSNATPGSDNGFSPSLARRLGALPQVAAVTSVRAGMARVYGATLPVLAADPTHVESLFDLGVTQGRIRSMTPAGIAVSTAVARDHHLNLGTAVPVTFPTTGRQVFTVQAVYTAREVAGDYVLTRAAAQANFPQQLDYQIFIKLAPGVTPTAGRRAVTGAMGAYPTATLLDQAQYKAQQSALIDQILNLVYGLLGLAVIIALIGIANTLALSIYERTRELGLLRAVGMTRQQLRATVRYESLIISMFGAIEGLVVGILLGWVMVAALHAQGVTKLVVPLPQLLAVTVLAALAGVRAAHSPGKRAARLDVLRAITSE
jgi:putative ABC transport system permease protein